MTRKSKAASARGRVEAGPEAVEPDSAVAPADEPTVTPVKDVSPAMAQFLEIKTANPDSLLWYRMGDFYELFFEDAVVAPKRSALC